jgi:hypothetical protein
MSYYWLNQRSSDGSNYDDDIGRVYHYRGNTPGAQQLEESDFVVYYRPGEHVLFGAGQIDRIEIQEENGPAATTNYYAHICDYLQFEPEIILKGVGESNLKNEISFLKEKEGLRGVPQHSIHEISREDYEMILNEAGVSIDRLIDLDDSK